MMYKPEIQSIYNKLGGCLTDEEMKKEFLKELNRNPSCDDYISSSTKELLNREKNRYDL